FHLVQRCLSLCHGDLFFTTLPRRRSRSVRPLQCNLSLGIFLGFGFWVFRICTRAHHALASRACTCTCTCAAAVLPAALACRAEPLRCASAFASAALVASCVSRNSFHPISLTGCGTCRNASPKAGS